MWWQSSSLTLSRIGWIGATLWQWSHMGIGGGATVERSINTSTWRWYINIKISKFEKLAHSYVVCWDPQMTLCTMLSSMSMNEMYHKLKVWLFGYQPICCHCHGYLIRDFCKGYWRSIHIQGSRSGKRILWSGCCGALPSRYYSGNEIHTKLVPWRWLEKNRRILCWVESVGVHQALWVCGTRTGSCKSNHYGLCSRIYINF